MAEDVVDTSVDNEIAQGDTASGAMTALVKSLTERLDKMQSDYKSALDSVTQDVNKLASVTQDVTKSMDIGADESQKRGVATTSSEWDSIAAARAWQATKAMAALDHLQQINFANFNFAIGLGQQLTVLESHQQSAKNCEWRASTIPTKT